ncbi:metal-dependent transcriptional regulator [Anaerostipes sp.]|uniref:metal-dependent transcriptional regulator n=1 Tax=Anaerostipes sp. TaxID=1872530 RepID=UPI0025BE41EB|nr:iron dependent repressor, metal binding and dimerization domain protein [Anaerostipes sp.]MBS7009586.1 metal-dependent transcriptional regulator [Anaerostipes sp.]
MEHKEGFYTLKGYQKGESDSMTASMEDYLEMICRLLLTEQVVRVSQLAQMLHVKPSSASKMVKNLKDSGYLLSEKYGYIRLTDKGKQAGDYLLFRHDVLNRFLCMVNQSEDELEQVEKIEHFINKRTLYNLEKFLKTYED